MKNKKQLTARINELADDLNGLHWHLIEAVNDIHKNLMDKPQPKEAEGVLQGRWITMNDGHKYEVMEMTVHPCLKNRIIMTLQKCDNK